MLQITSYIVSDDFQKINMQVNTWTWTVSSMFVVKPSLLQRKIHGTEVWKVLHCHVYVVVKAIIRHEGIFEVFSN